MGSLRLSWLGFAVTAFVATACAPPKPVEIPSTFEPPDKLVGKYGGSGQSSSICAIAVSDIQDLRPDPGAMGTVGLTPLTMADISGWLRSGFRTLNARRGIHIVDDPHSAHLVLRVEILKAYAMNITTETRTANIVMRVRYNGKDVSDEHIYRGTTNNVTWFSAEKESYGSLNAALEQVLDAIATDIRKRC